MEGFFSRTELAVIDSPQSTVPKCGACGLLKTCQSPKMPVAGRGRRKVLVVGEAPGRQEDERNKPFVGDAGQRLQKLLAAIDVDLFEDCWVTNALICRPPNNATPTMKQVDYCRPNLTNLVNRLKPRVIIPLGKIGVRAVVGWLWKKNPGKIGRWVGVRAPAQRCNAWVCPTYHPRFVMREDSPVLDLIVKQHLKAAFKFKKRPWKKVPDFKGRVRVLLDSREASRALSNMFASSPLCAFDYETNMLKPDSRRARIVCCGVSDGKTAVAFPWRGEPVRIMKNWLKSNRAKIASNLKFEDRWTEAKVGVKVNNWVLDTMVAAHTLDNRRDRSGLKYQAFVRLGQPEYDSAVTPFLKAREKGGHFENRIMAAPLTEILTYCGMDALLEFILARVQAKDLGLEL